MGPYNKTAIRELYFKWLIKKIDCEQYRTERYTKVLKLMFNTEFIFSVSRDVNRALDGVRLREFFEDDYTDQINSSYIYDSLSDEPCSVLEMLVALSIRCEEEIMHDSQKGDRTRKWFWLMIDNLKLTEMSNDSYKDELAASRIDIFLERRYLRDGSKGGLFVIPHHKKDLRTAEIWYQMNWYLDILDE